MESAKLRLTIFPPLQTHYHYIITGGGCAGLSLLMRMMKEPYFTNKEILVIDQSPKIENDRTWCFWEKEAGLFEPIVHHQWRNIHFYANEFSGSMAISPYQYKMIRGIDFYNHVHTEAKNHSHIERRNEKVKAISNKGDKVHVELTNETITADYIFNSILFNTDFLTPSSAGREVSNYLLLQHFKGWLIKTKEPVFDAETATFMDFRISQKGGTAFMYVLPTSSTTALVEYTLFTEKLLPPESYEIALKNYISNLLKINDYTISHEEFGVIPMTNHRFSLQEGRIVNIGVAGGQVKGSSGFAFRFIQKRTEQIVQSLINKGHPFIKESFSTKKSKLYDSVLLNVLYNRKMMGDKIFTLIFQKNPPQRVLRFLDNETNIWEDFQIMQSVPTGIFLPAAFYQIIH